MFPLSFSVSAKLCELLFLTGQPQAGCSAHIVLGDRVVRSKRGGHREKRTPKGGLESPSFQSGLFGNTLFLMACLLSWDQVTCLGIEGIHSIRERLSLQSCAAVSSCLGGADHIPLPSQLRNTRAAVRVFSILQQTVPWPF